MQYLANVFKKITSLIINFLFINPFFIPLLIACFISIASLRMEISYGRGYVVPSTDSRATILGGANERKLDRNWLARNSYKYTHYKNYERLSTVLDVPSISSKKSLHEFLKNPAPAYVQLVLNSEIKDELTVSKAQLSDHRGALDSDLAKSSWFPRYFTTSEYNHSYPYLAYPDKLPPESLQGDFPVDEMSWTVHKVRIGKDVSYVETFSDRPDPSIYLKESKKVEIVCPILELSLNRHVYVKYLQTGPYKYASLEEILRNLNVLSDRDCLSLFAKGSDLSGIVIEGVLWHNFKYNSFEEMSKKLPLYNMWMPVLSQNSAPSMLSITRVLKDGKEVYSFKNIYDGIDKYNKEIRSFTRKPQTIAMVMFTAVFILAFVAYAIRLISNYAKSNTKKTGLTAFSKFVIVGYSVWVVSIVSVVLFLTHYTLQGYWPLGLDFILSEGYSF